MKLKTGTLYGIGVGPGDPELLTVKSVRIISEVDVVFAAASTKNNYSLAVNIAETYIPKKTTVQVLQFPMSKNQEETCKAWKTHADTIISVLEQGKNAVFLTLGDPMTYSTYGYILKNIQNIAPHIPITTIPGITSYQAAAACINTPLVEGEESLMVVSRSQWWGSSAPGHDKAGKRRFYEGISEYQGHQSRHRRNQQLCPMRRGLQMQSSGAENLSRHAEIQ